MHPCRFPFAIALFCMAVAAQAQKPRIEVMGADTLDFGRYPAREARVARYAIRNAGDAALRIIQVRKTCGCATATCDREELEPGERATVEVSILPHSIFGLFSKNTFVESNDPGNRFLRLTVSGHAVPLLEISPSDTVYAARIPTNAPWVHTFDIKATEPGVELGALTLDGNYPSEAVTNRIGVGEPSHYRLDLRITPTLASGDVKCVVAIPVLVPSGHPPIRINVGAKVGAELNAVPGVFHLAVSDQPLKRVFSLHVLGQRTRVLDPASLQLPAQEGVTFSVEQDGDGRGLRVRTTFTPDFTKQLYAEEKISLIFEVPGASSAKVICKARK